MVVNKAQWLVLYYDAIKHLRNLRISPMLGCVPQDDRRPRTMIVDYTSFGLNDDMVPIAPRDASMQFGNALPRLLRHVVLTDPAHGPIQLVKVDMHPPHEAMQFGCTLERLLFRIRHANPRYGPVYINKIDVSDGFYRVALAASSAPKLAVVLPTRPGEPTLLAIPLSLPMGWIESPPLPSAPSRKR
jgi:hypothetical protein